MMMRRYQVLASVVAVSWILVAGAVANAQQQSSTTQVNEKSPADENGAAGSDARKSGSEPSSTLDAREKRFQELLTGATLVGHFTIDGRPLDQLREERYEIKKVEKLPDGDYWAITARIVYGDRDLTLPVPIEVKWAGNSPVLTLDQFTVPGLGTFSARVVLHRNKYAGIWQHDDVGGHLFGYVELPAGNSTDTDAATSHSDVKK